MRLSLFSLFFTLISISVHCQEAPSPSFGAKAGLNFATIGGESNPFTVKGNVGIYGIYHFNYLWQIRTEFLFSGQGHGEDELGIKTNLSYLNLPILAGYSTDYNLNFHVGPQIGFLVGAKSKVQGSTFDIKDALKTVDVGLVIDVTYYLMENRLGASVRYIHGLSNINDTNFGGNIFNRVIQLTASWRLFVLE